MPLILNQNWASHPMTPHFLRLCSHRMPQPLEVWALHPYPFDIGVAPPPVEAKCSVLYDAIKYPTANLISLWDVRDITACFFFNTSILTLSFSFLFLWIVNGKPNLKYVVTSCPISKWNKVKYDTAQINTNTTVCREIGPALWQIGSIFFFFNLDKF